MKLAKSTGWRTLAVVNIAWLTVATITLISLVIAGSTAGGGLRKAFIFYSGRCRDADVYRLNMGLHFLLNVFSTAVLASSNFFMQILNAPTRAEVDIAHAKGSFVHIGVPSMRNAFRVARVKGLGWGLLLLSSVPLHLLFNAAIFESDSRESNYFLVIADEGFAKGEPYYLPGASLVAPYQGPLSYNEKNISATAMMASGWTRLEKEACADEYIACRGLQNYANVVVVVESRDGWVRDRLWDLPANVTEFWRTRVPAEQPNSLWYSASCSMRSRPVYPGRIGCTNSCYRTLGAANEEGLGGPLLGPASDWTIPFFNKTGLREGYDRLPVRYCLAQPAEYAGRCGVGLSNLLLFCVTICVIVKTATSAVVFWKCGHQHMLVTLGDAVESFIAEPDETTVATDYLHNAAKAKKSAAGDEPIMPTPWRVVHRRGFSAINPSAWVANGLVLFAGVGGCIAFISLFGVLQGGIPPINIFMGNGKKEVDLGTDFMSGALGIIIATNAPQLGLSIWYLAYNSLLTRLMMAREWAAFSTSYRPLRVTKPQGRQVSTYRLQLPYRYSIPLIIASALFHWLMSNAFYVFVSQGSYFYRTRYENGKDVGWMEDDQMPPRSILSMRYSVGTLLLLTILATVMVLILVVLTFRPLPGYMPVVGTVSALISAACHVSPLAKVEPQLCTNETEKLASLSDDEVSVREGEQCEDADEEASALTDPADLRVKVARCKLKWGVVDMPPDWLSAHRIDSGADNDEGHVEHLSFGTMLDEVRTPIEGKLYE